MVTSIQLGNFFTANGRTVLGGVSGSGLDLAGLMEGLSAAKRLPAVEFENKIETNSQVAAALSEFRTLVSRLKDATNFLRNPPGVNNNAENAFKYATAALSSNSSVAATNYISVIASPGAIKQNYVISDITSVARAKQQSTADISVADETTAAAVSATPAGGQFQAGTFTLNGVDITLEDGDTLREVAAKFNAVSGETNITASIIKVADGTYRMFFSSTETGNAYDFDLNDIGTVSSDPSGVMASVGITDIQDASDAEFKFNGIDIVRSNNSISDIVSGVTFNILQMTPTEPDPTELTVSIEPDVQTARNGIVNLVNAYNDLKIFIARQTEVNESGGFSSDALLATNSTFRSLATSINSQFTSFVSGLANGQPNRLADIGITFVDLPETSDTPQVRNVMNVDEAQLASAIASNYDGVRRVFEFDFVSDNPNLQLFSRSNALAVSDFTLDINPGTTTFQATYDIGAGPVTIDMDVTPISGTPGGYTLRGPADSPLAGLVMIYAGQAVASINVTTTQGIADKAFNVVNEPAKTDSGIITAELEALQEDDIKLTEEIRRIDEQVAIFREQLLAKFQALESALSRINTLLQSLEAEASARNNN